MPSVSRRSRASGSSSGKPDPNVVGTLFVPVALGAFGVAAKRHEFFPAPPVVVVFGGWSVYFPLEVAGPD